MQVSIIDYNMGNLESVNKALCKLNIHSIVTNNQEDIANSDIILLPGVGAYKAGMEHLHELNLINFLNNQVMVKKKPFLGICLGMQLISSFGNEPIKTEGLGWIKGEVVKIDSEKLRVPHIGWNEISIKKEDYYPNNLKSKDFYFIHSYHFKPEDPACISSTVSYGKEIVAGIKKDNIFAVQFHPEKSQNSGLKLLDNYFKKHVKN